VVVRKLVPVLMAAVASLVLAAPATARPPGPENEGEPPPSGVFVYRDITAGDQITECPQAGLRSAARPLDRRRRDVAERISRRSDDIRANQDFSCFPQNETTIAINPLETRNLVGGANDYRLGFSSSGFYASTDRGRTFYDGVIPYPSVPTNETLDSAGDPVTAYDREGIVYFAEIAFNRDDDTNGIFVSRSTNGGFTWSRGCVPLQTSDTDEDASVCGPPGDPRQPGDGNVTYFKDNNRDLDGSVPFDDKEWLASGPRPRGVGPQCFAPVTNDPVACNPAVVGRDRLYVTWTRFDTDGTANIMLSYSDDQARSWADPRAISGSAPFCDGGVCNFNQFSVPTVHPRTGLLGVAFENFNTEAENQYLFVRSRDGGASFEGPFFVTPVFDINYPLTGEPPNENRPDCEERGQAGGESVLTNSCFRVNAGGNVVVDKRSGAFGDDFYLVMSDNRNGTPASSNTDVFFFKSTDGGATWVGPTRVNNDRSALTGSREDVENDGDFGNDQWFPWMDVSSSGELAFGFNDRRLDRNSTASEWPMSRSRPGNYLTWFFGAGCRIERADSRDCLAPGATAIAQPSAPIHPGGGPQPGQGDQYTTTEIANQRLSDVPFNLDYSFRAGIFAGDYSAVAFPNQPGGDRSGRGRGHDRALGLWTDARNGRGSGGEASFQPGRNPLCEQSDAFATFFDPQRRLTTAAGDPSAFLVSPCPQGSVSPRDGRFDGNPRHNRG
jgi:hypothetical protein